MTTIRIQLDDATYERLRRIAAAAGLTPDEYLARRAREEAGVAPAAEAAKGDRSGAGIIGLFADEPEAVDEMLALVMKWREERNRAMFERIDHLAEELDEDAV